MSSESRREEPHERRPAQPDQGDHRDRALRAAEAPIAAVDILPNPEYRKELSALSGWPTIPQVFVKGELIGGADIVQELAMSGELVEKLQDALGADYRAPGEEKTLALAEAAA